MIEMRDEDKRPETIDEKDLYEDLTEEEIFELLKNNDRQEVNEEEKEKPKRPFPKWVFWLIAFFLVINIVSVAPGFFSLPAIEFIKTSARLLVDDDIQTYKESVVLIDTGSGRGTGFSISDDGYIVTNHHVVEEKPQIIIHYPELKGSYEAEIELSYPEYDLALLKVDAEDLPYLTLAEEAQFYQDEHIYFIGNPLRFSGIANEGQIIDMTNSSLETPVIMLNAPIYRGNSGSPVINRDGEVIAVIYATRNDSEHGRVGLAIPIDIFHAITDDSFLSE